MLLRHRIRQKQHVQSSCPSSRAFFSRIMSWVTLDRAMTLVGENESGTRSRVLRPVAHQTWGGRSAAPKVASGLPSGAYLPLALAASRISKQPNQNKEYRIEGEGACGGRV